MEFTVSRGDALHLPLADASVDAVVTDPPYGLRFMGKDWDHGVPGVPFWEEALRVMKPGAHLLAFGGTRTHHRLMVAIEDAGFEVRDCLMWLTGQGFPKSHNFGREMDGWDGWGTALKPAWEPIVLAMKSLDGTFAENALRHGVAGLNVDGCRIRTDENLSGGAYAKDGSDRYDGYDNWRYRRDGGAGEYVQPSGRWPANLLLSHLPECEVVGVKRVRPSNGSGVASDRSGGIGGGMFGDGEADNIGGSHADADGTETVEDWRCADGCPVAMLDGQSGETVSRVGTPRRSALPGNGYGMVHTGAEYSDAGGASRFFYCAKASRSERDAGLDGRRNNHPTVKSLAVCRWLVRLVTRPDHLVLDPFMGSGSIGCAAMLERRRFVGLDIDPEYVKVARARISYWQKRRDVPTPEKPTYTTDDPAQGRLL